MSADVPEVRMNGDSARNGGRLEADGDGWTLTDTSEGGAVGNEGTSFVFAYGPDACIVTQINAVLNRPVGSEPADFLLQATIQRTSASSRLVAVSVYGEFKGSRQPGRVFPKAIDLKENAAYESASTFALAATTPAARFRVWPSGGGDSINGLSFSVGLRVDANSSPETMRIRDFGVSQIEKDGVSDTATRRVVLCPEGLPPAAFIGAWRELGLHARVGLAPEKGETVAGIYADAMDFNALDARRIGEYIESGTRLFLSTGLKGGTPDPALAKWLPVNAWSFNASRLRRHGCLAVPSASSGLDAPAVPFGARFDMHLPGAAIESPMVRYFPGQYLRDRKVFTRTSIVMECGGDGWLPMLVDGDVGPSRILVFAASYGDSTACASPGYNDWARTVAKLPFGAKLPDASITVDPLLDWATREAMQPYAIAIEEDESTLVELASSPAPKEGIDGITSYRYVYRTGTSPTITLRLRNHFNNIAPLATARDLVWPENASASGLNDLAFTHASVRGQLPIHPVWCGKPSAQQRLALDWKSAAVVSGIRLTGGGAHRSWFRNNPKDFAVIADGNALFSVTNAIFIDTSATERAVFETMFDAPRPSTASLELAVSNLDPAANREPRRDWPSNCSITEWEVWGWAGDPVGEKPRTIHLVMETEDLRTGAVTRRDLGMENLAPYSEKKIALVLDTRPAFGPVRYRFTARDGEVLLAEKAFDVLYVPAAGTKLANKVEPDCANAGLLCTPGWRAMDSFGLGMNDWTRGWGGVHDKLWAFSQDLLGMGMRNRDDPSRMLVSATRASHYANPWRSFQNGTYSWDWVRDNLLERMKTGDWHRKGATALHVLGSDSWNGFSAGNCFGWDVFVDFDRWLRGRGEAGLEAKSRRGIVREISEKLGDKWQVFNLERYADKMLETKRRFAEAGFDFTFETHGSFPLAGGELGRKLAEVDVGVGTDLFWELRLQDLWWSLGGRISVVAANPNLRSGMYDEWGWVNSEINNFWFANNGDDTVARRQWYATYFLGRVMFDGTFRPYHEMGFTSQGSHGARYTMRDHLWRTRISDFVTQIRPEQASGFGLVVSWRGQERRMGPKLGRAGFGLFPEDGEDDIETLCAETYTPLVKQGVPISFVTSTDALKNWKGTNPLILIDAPNWEDWELAEVRRLQQASASVVSIGAPHPKLANENALKFFSEARVADDNGGGIVSWNHRPETLDAISAGQLWDRIRGAIGDPIQTSRGLVVVPFVSQGHLFLAVCRQGDDSTPGSVTIKPEFFYPGAKGCSRVVSLDDGKALPLVKLDSGAIKVEFPMEDASGRVLMFVHRAEKAEE
jgi:hypothetical protein